MKFLTAFLTYEILFFMSFSMPLKPNQTVTSWLSVEYMDCLSKKLPCDCEKTVNKYISINLDTSLTSNTERITLYGHPQLEPFFYKLSRLNDNRYNILTGEKEPKKLGAILLNKDSLYLYAHNVKTKYVKIGTSNKLDNYNYQAENIHIINNALKKNGHPSLNKILSENLLSCECNKAVDRRVNMVSVKGKPDAWVLERDKDSLYIYKIMNADADPDDAIVKKKIYQYKMK
ncbi:MAG: hypothetical protein V4456_23180 [Bacteroidota bacterium]